MNTMDLKQARAIARSVGATIEEVEGPIQERFYRVRLGVCVIGSNGTREYPEFHLPNPSEAAAFAVLETAKAAKSMMDIAKQVYVESDLIFIR